MKLLSGIAILGLVLSVAACGNNSSNAELVAKQQAEIEKIKADAELAKAETAKLQAEAEKLSAEAVSARAQSKTDAIAAENEAAKQEAYKRAREHPLSFDLQ